MRVWPLKIWSTTGGSADDKRHRSKEVKRLVTTAEWLAYKRLSTAVLYYVVGDYRWIYWRYITGQCTRHIYERQRRILKDALIELMIDLVLHDTPEGLARRVEEKVKEEVANGCFEKLRKFKVGVKNGEAET